MVNVVVIVAGILCSGTQVVFISMLEINLRLPCGNNNIIFRQLKGCPSLPLLVLC